MNWKTISQMSWGSCLMLLILVGCCSCGSINKGLKEEDTRPESSKRTGPSSSICGGFAAIPCSEGYKCVDDPNDTCSPLAGGADCPGICVSAD